MDDRREYLRIRTRVNVLLKKIDSEDAYPTFRVNSDLSLQSNFNYKELGLPEGVSLFFKYLDGKLDLIISLLGIDLLEREFDFKTTGIELSEGAVKCVCDFQGIGVGDLVEVVIYLSHIPLVLVSAMGRVIRIERQEDGEYLVVAFERIRDRDRELIVRFVFQEQREKIRSEKEEI